jgi:Nucleotide-diphospho-sugar transferase
LRTPPFLMICTLLFNCFFLQIILVVFTRSRPYMGNGGFFYVRQNHKTRYLLNSLLLLSDSNGGNEQFQLNQLMAEHASLYGLKVKVLRRDEFPTGAVYQRLIPEDEGLMKGILEGRTTPFMFHMSWTSSKKDKLLYFRQMGEWYVQERCIGNNSTSILGSKRTRRESLIAPCCSAKPLISCHYGNMPSLSVCKNNHRIPLGDGELPYW